MQIGAEQFQQIVAAAKAQASDRRSEKREAVRIGVRYTIIVRPIIPGINVAATPFSAFLRDISGKGVGLTCPVAVIGRFTLETPNALDVLHVVKCRTTSCRRIDKEQFQVGAIFEE